MKAIQTKPNEDLVFQIGPTNNLLTQLHRNTKGNALILIRENFIKLLLNFIQKLERKIPPPTKPP